MLMDVLIRLMALFGSWITLSVTVVLFLIAVRGM